MAYFKDIPGIGSVEMAAPNPIAVPPSAGAKRTAALNYNRLGGLMEKLCAQSGISIEAALAVWLAESGSLGYKPGATVLRFENHKFFKHWGSSNASRFDDHFQFGGRGGVPGKSWQNHKWRRISGSSWQSFHGDQDSEYEVFHSGSTLGSAEAAALSCSFGGCQILGSNHGICGYGSAQALFDAFNQSERWEICAFFDFCQGNNALDELRNGQWEDFAEIYNGAGNAKHYGKIIETNFEIISSLLASQPLQPTSAASGGPMLAMDFSSQSQEAKLMAYIKSLGLNNFKPYELMTMGHQHSNPNSPAFGLNTLPPEELWPNIEKTIRLLDKLRDLLNAAIVIHSAYRSPAYNTAIGGEAGSQHLKFRAIDFVVKSTSSPADWAATLRQMRANGEFSGGIGTYPTFVHLDTRGTNADW